MQYDPKLEEIITDENSQEEWVDTHYHSTEFTNEAKDLTTDTPSNDKIEVAVEADEDDEDGPPVDLDDFMASEDVEVEDPNCFKPTEETSASGDNVLKTRTYDLHITYDKYYQVCFFKTNYFIRYNSIQCHLGSSFLGHWLR